MKTRCKRDHDLTDPAVAYIRPDNKVRQCRLCHREKAKRWREANRDKLREVNQRYYRGVRGAR